MLLAARVARNFVKISPHRPYDLDPIRPTKFGADDCERPEAASDLKFGQLIDFIVNRLTAFFELPISIRSEVTTKSFGTEKVCTFWYQKIE